MKEKPILISVKELPLISAVDFIGGVLIGALLARKSCDVRDLWSTVSVTLLLLGVCARWVYRCRIFAVLRKRYPEWITEDTAFGSKKGIRLFLSAPQERKLLEHILGDPDGAQIEKEYSIFEKISMLWQIIPAITTLIAFLL